MGVLAFDEVPHLVELSLRNRQVPQQVPIDLVGLLSGAFAPGQHGLCRHPAYTADPCQINPDQKHFESHHDFVFRRAEVEKGRLTGLSKVRFTRAPAKDTTLTALGEIRRDSTHVTACRSAIMSTLGIGARLAPVFGCSHGSILRVV